MGVRIKAPYWNQKNGVQVTEVIMPAQGTEKRKNFDQKVSSREICGRSDSRFGTDPRMRKSQSVAERRQ
jgi:hypothetical protein